MKRLIIALAGFFAICGVQAQESYYEIDPVATANAPWNMGDEVGLGSNRSKTRFLGVTQDGYFMVQEFHVIDGNDNTKKTDPYIVMNETGITLAEPSLYHGRKTLYDMSGDIVSDCYYQYGTMESPPCVSEGEVINVKSESVTFYENDIYLKETTVYKNAIPVTTILLSYDYQTKTEDEIIIENYLSGQKMMEQRTQNGERVGIERYWDENGTLTKEIEHGYHNI